MWSRTDPATLFGAAVTGWADVRAAFEWPGRRSPTARPGPNEISAAGASGDLAHTVALEHTTASVNGAPPALASEAADPRPTPQSCKFQPETAGRYPPAPCPAPAGRAETPTQTEPLWKPS